MSSSWILKASCPVLKSTEPKVYFTIHISIVLCCNRLQLSALQLTIKCTASEGTYCCAWILCLLSFDEAAFAGSCPKATKDWQNTWNSEKGVRDWKKGIGNSGNQPFYSSGTPWVERRAKPHSHPAKEASGIIKTTMIIQLPTQSKGVKPWETDFWADKFLEGDQIKAGHSQGSLQTHIKSTQAEQKAAELKKDALTRTSRTRSTACKGYCSLGNGRWAEEAQREIETICQKDQDMRGWSEAAFRHNFSICASHLFK